MENIAQIHSKLDKMPDSYLSELVQNKSPFATVAAMVLDTRQGMAQKMTEPPTSTVADKVAAQTGLPSVAQPQNNQDPRLMAGVGNMPITPRDSVDTPMTGVAQLPAEQMMADGGIVGYQEGGDVKYFGRDGVIFDTTNPLDYLMAVPGLGVGYGAARLGYKGLKALPALGRTLNPSGGFKNLKTALGRRQLGKATKGSKTDTELRSRTMKGRRDPETGRIRSDEAIGAGVLAPYARYGSGAAGLGALGYFGSELLPEGSEEKALEQPNFNSDMPDKSSFDKEGFMKELYRQMQLTGRNVATDKSGQGLLGSVLGGYGKAVGDLAASDEAQENKLAQLGVSALARSRVTPANRLKAIEITDERRQLGLYRQEAISAVETSPAAVQAELAKYKIVASGKEQLIAEYEKLIAERDGLTVLNQISGMSLEPSTAGYSVAPSTAG